MLKTLSPYAPLAHYTKLRAHKIRVLLGHQVGIQVSKDCINLLTGDMISLSTVFNLNLCQKCLYTLVERIEGTQMLKTLSPYAPRAHFNKLLDCH